MGVTRTSVSRFRHIVWALGAAITVLLVAGITVIAVLWHGTQGFADEYDGLLLPGTRIAGVDVAGMSPEQAEAALAALVAPELAREVVVTAEGREWRATRADLGASADVTEQVQAAMDTAHGLSWRELYHMRWHDQPLGFDAEVTVSDDPERIRGFVERIAGALDRPAADAEQRWDSGWVTVRPSRTGFAVDVDATAAAVTDAVQDSGGRVPVVGGPIAPAVTEADLPRVLLVREADQRLYLYERGVRVREFVVSTGTGNYPTPGGVFEVGTKRHRPTWVNPSPDGWGRSLPRRIGPGRHNPLGLRAINWNTPEGSDTLIRFHGTAAVSQLGQPASHGCVRLSNDDAVELFELVEPGDLIVSVRG